MIPYVIHAVNPVNECSGIKSRPLNSQTGHKGVAHFYKKITLTVGINQEKRTESSLGEV